MTSTLHVYPNGDLIEHDWLLVHHSLDGREQPSQDHHAA